MKEKNCNKRAWIRAGKFDDHHIQARSRGGQNIQSNLLHMDIRRHQAFHLLFHNLTLLEASELLNRTQELKDKSKLRKYL